MVVPKVETAAHVQQVARVMAAFGAPSEMEIWAMIETPVGVLNVEEIAASHCRVRALVAGTSDLSKV